MAAPLEDPGPREGSSAPMQPGFAAPGWPEGAGAVPSGAVPSSVAGAVAMVEAGLDYLNAACLAGLPTAAQKEALTGLGRAGAKYTAAHAAVLGAFSAGCGYEADGQYGPVPWLMAVTRVTKGAARGAAGWVRRLAAHPGVAGALAAGTVSESFARAICEWTDRLPGERRAAADAILLAAAAGGVSLSDLAVLAADMYERSRAGAPDPDDPDEPGGFGDRSLRLETTFGGAGRLAGDLTPACAAALTAVLDALGKHRGPEDTRTVGQRHHDALEEALRLLIGAGMLPERAGQPTQVHLHIPLSQLRQLPGASQAEAAWLAARAGEPGYLAGRDAEAAACDATIIPVVTGQVDWAVIDQMMQVWLTAHGLPAASGKDTEASRGGGHGGRGETGGRGGRGETGGRGCGCTCGRCTCTPPLPMSAHARARLRRTLLAMAVDALSGPAGLPAYLRAAALGQPYNTASLPLDIGYADSIPAHIRRAVILRDKHCQWAGGCDRPAAACEVHHLIHKADGGPTSVKSCILLCTFHHQICIHRWGWTLILHPDGTTEAKSPWGQILRSHAPPTGTG